MQATTKDKAYSARVVHIVPALFSKEGGVLGGAERFALDLAREMATQVPTTLVTFGDQARAEKVDDLEVRVIGNPTYIRGQRANPFEFRSLVRMLRQGDVVHCHQQHVVSSSFAALFCRLTGKRVFVSDLGGGGWDISRYVSTDRLYHGHLHISQYSRQVFKQSNLKSAHVIMSGVDVGKFYADPSIKRTGTVLFVGRLLPHKGINYLVEAMPPEMPLEIIGQPYAPEFLRYLKQLATGKNIVFRHDCDDRTLVDAYRSCRCIVLPSVYETIYGQKTNVPELLGQVLLEGMACGAPAICTKVAAMPEVVQEGISGFVVAPNDPAALRERLIWLRDHPERAIEMGCAATQRVLNCFTWKQVVKKCLAIYAA